MKSIQLAWRPGTARFEATGRSGTRIAFEAPGEPAEILVVDDNPVNRMLMKAYLEKLGCACFTANDGHEAVDFLAGHEVWAVFMDCQMPVMDGFEATAEIRRREDQSHHTPGQRD